MGETGTGGARAELGSTRVQWKLLTVGVLLAASGVGGLAAEQIRAERVAEQQSQDQYEVNLSVIMPRSPQDWLRVIHSHVAHRLPDKACYLLAEPVRVTFAREHRAQDCPAAMTALSDQVRDVGRYELPLYEPDQVVTIDGDRASLDLCRGYWRDVLVPVDAAGPLLGRFDLKRILGQGYQAVGWTPCPVEPSAAPSAPSVAGTTAVAQPVPVPQPPPTTSAPGLLPSYPPSYPGVLTRAIGRRDVGVCGYFTSAGAAEFAQAVGAATCADAVAELAERVADPGVYGQPQAGSASAVTLGGGQSDVDACALTWLTWPGGASTPGPQLGRLHLERPAGAVGYLVAGFRAC